MPDPLSDGATFEEMVEKAAKGSFERSASDHFFRHPWHELSQAIRQDYREDARTALTAAGVPDLLSSLRAKDALIESLREENATAEWERNRASKALGESRATVERLRGALSFEALREANVTRCKRWHPGFLSDPSGPGWVGEEWTGADWSNAMCGEAGETANVVKKLRRVETGTDQGPDDPAPERLREMLADEIADTVTYADLLAAYYGIDLAEAIAAKFNRVSERQGFPDRLRAALSKGDEKEGSDGA